MTKESKIMGPSVGFTDLLDHVTNEKLKQDAEALAKGERKMNPLRPSSAGKCSRELALDLMGFRGIKFYPKPLISPDIYRLFSLGHAVEYDILKHFRLLPFEVRYKQQQLELFKIKRKDDSLPPEYLEGSCDFVLWSDAYRCIGDIKSKKAKYSSYMSSSWEEDFEKYGNLSSVRAISSSALWIEDLDAFLKDIGEDFIADNFWQLNAYAHADFIKKRGIDFATLIYYNKGTSQLFEIRFKPSESVFKRLEEKFNKVSLMVDDGQIPEQCDFTPGSIRYAFCGCHQMLEPGIEEPRKLWFQTFPKKKWPTDVSKLSVELQNDLKDWAERQKSLKAQKALEERIISQMLEAKVKKVKLDNSRVYELKFLKTPKEHFELRDAKL